jgi:hypothetical protein
MTHIDSGDVKRKPRHYCRNPRCRTKLRTPVENEHHAFCAKGCFESFYRSRCRVCEDPLRRKRENQKLGSGHKICEAEYRKFSRVYDFPAQGVRISDESTKSTHSTGFKFGLAGNLPSAWCLRDWWWGDLSLYNREGLTRARLLHRDGRYHLLTPITSPRTAWSDLREAKRQAESLALAAIPLEAIDPKLAARIKRDKETTHPLGRPLNLAAGGELMLGAGHRIGTATGAK